MDQQGFLYRDIPAERMGFMRMLLLGMDPPAHRRHRRIVAGVLKAQAIEALMPMMRERARAIVDRVAPRGNCEFVQEAAAELRLFEYGMALGQKLLEDTQSTALARQVLVADIDGDRITPDKFCALFYILLLGGTELTAAREMRIAFDA